jgi:hypothetical protein
VIDNVFNLLRDLLFSTSTSVPIPQLRADARWQILIDTLRGHAKIRGRRVRDFPMSRFRFQSGQLIEALSDCNVSVRKSTNKCYESGSYSLMTFIYALDIVEISNREKQFDPKNENEYFSTLIVVLLSEIFCEAKFSEIYTKSIAIQLGVTASEFKKYVGGKKCRVSPIFNSAKDLSLITSLKYSSEEYIPELILRLGFYPKRLEEYENNCINLIYIKTRHVQSFLDLCNVNYLVRGASFWCSQLLSHLRDFLLNNLKTSSLIIDSDAVVIIATPSNADENAYQLLAKYLDSDQFYEHIDSEYPRAAQFRKGASYLLPSFGVETRRSICLFDLATQRENNYTTDKPSYWNDKNTISQVSSTDYLKSDVQSCSMIDGEYAIESEFVPPWYNNSVNKDSYSPSALIFSLADVTFHQETILETKYQIERLTKVVFNYSDFHNSICNTLDLGPSMSFIKIDGDDIGVAFSTIPFLCRPELSYSLESAIKSALVNSCSDTVAKAGHNHILHDLIYAGGDDLFFSIPTDVELDFLTSLGKHLTELLPDLRHTATVLRLDMSSVKAQDAEANRKLSLIPKLINYFLKQAKNKLKGCTVSSSTSSNSFSYGSLKGEIIDLNAYDMRVLENLMTTP